MDFYWWVYSFSVQKSKAVLEWKGLASFIGLVKEKTGEAFVRVVQPFDNAKIFTHAEFKEYASLTKDYWEQFVQWLNAPDCDITLSTVNKKLKSLRQLMMVRIHVMHPNNEFVHPARRMFVFTDIGEMYFPFHRYR